MEVLRRMTSARCSRSPDGWLVCVARLPCTPCRARMSLERTLGVWPARCLASDVFFFCFFFFFFFCSCRCSRSSYHDLVFVALDIARVELQAAGRGMQTKFSTQRSERLFVQLANVVVPARYHQRCVPI